MSTQPFLFDKRINFNSWFKFGLSLSIFFARSKTPKPRTFFLTFSLLTFRIWSNTQNRKLGKKFRRFRSFPFDFTTFSKTDQAIITAVYQPLHGCSHWGGQRGYASPLQFPNQQRSTSFSTVQKLHNIYRLWYNF